MPSPEKPSTSIVAVQEPHSALAPIQEDVMPWKGEADPATRYLSTLGEGSKPTQKTAVLQLAAAILRWRPSPEQKTPPAWLVTVVPWHRLSAGALMTLRAELVETYQPATVNRMLVALRQIMRVCKLSRWMDPVDHDALLDLLKGVKVSKRPAGRELAAEELKALLAACPVPKYALPGALIALAAGAGLRVSDLLSLQYEDVDLSTGRVFVVGKGSKARTTALAEDARGAVQSYASLRGRAVGPMFIHPRNPSKPFSSKMVSRLLRDAAGRAGLKETVTPHDLRRTWATQRLRAGADILQVSKAMGHSSTDTTRIYDRRSEEELVSALGKATILKSK